MCDHSAYFVIVKKTFDVLYPVLTFIFKMYVITYCLCLNRLSISTAKCTASFKESNSVQYMKKNLCCNKYGTILGIVLLLTNIIQGNIFDHSQVHLQGQSVKEKMFLCALRELWF